MTLACPAGPGAGWDSRKTPDNAFHDQPTDIQSATGARFQFPACSSSAPWHGRVDPRHRAAAPARAAGVAVKHDDVTVRKSKAGNYVSVRIAFHARDRAQYDAAHEALRSHPEVKWTI